LYAGEAILMRKAHDIDSMVLTHWLCFTNVVLFAAYGFDKFLHVNLIDFGLCLGAALFGNIG